MQKILCIPVTERIEVLQAESVHPRMAHFFENAVVEQKRGRVKGRDIQNVYNANAKDEDAHSRYDQPFKQFTGSRRPITTIQATTQSARARLDVRNHVVFVSLVFLVQFAPMHGQRAFSLFVVHRFRLRLGCRRRA